MPLKLVTVKKSKNFHVRGAHCGTRVFESTGLSDRGLAEAYRVRLEGQIQTAHAYGTKDAISFASAAAMYMQSGGGRQYMVPVIKEVGVMKVDQLRQSDLDALALKLYPDASPATRNRQAYTPFIAVMNYAANSDFCPLRKWRRPKAGEKVRKSRHADTTEIAFLHHAAVKHAKRIILFLVYSGLRMGELVNLDWADIDLDKQWAVIRKTKTGKQRGIPLHRLIVQDLMTVKNRSGKVILDQNMKSYERNYRGGGIARKALQTAIRKSGIDHLTWHDLRHTCATWLQMAGIDRETRQDILGHTRGAVHDTYVHVPQNRLIEAINKMEDFTLFPHPS